MLSRLLAFLLVSLTLPRVVIAQCAQWDPGFSSHVPGINGTVGALAVFDDGSGPALFAAGAFGSADGVSALRIAKWNGMSWSPLGAPGSGIDDTVHCLAVFNDGRDAYADLYVGGRFKTAGSFESLYIAEWRGCAGTPVPFCFGDGSTIGCPCANSGLPGHGCDNSIATGGAFLTASGTTVPDALVLAQTSELATSLSIFLQGTSELASPALFGDGLRCVGGALKRLYTKNASLGSVSAPLSGDPSITAQSALLGDPIAAGSTRHYQVHYRDPDLGFCPSPQGSSFNVGNALRVTW